MSSEEWTQEKVERALAFALQNLSVPHVADVLDRFAGEMRREGWFGSRDEFVEDVLTRMHLK